MKKVVFRIVALCLMLTLLFAGTALAVSARVTVPVGYDGVCVDAGTYDAGDYIFASINSNTASTNLSLQLFTTDGKANIAKTNHVAVRPLCGGYVPALGDVTQNIACTLLIINEGEVTTDVIYSVGE